MAKKILLIASIIVGTLIAEAQHIDVVTLDTTATELTIPPCQSITPFTGKGFNNLRKITFNNIDYLPPCSFHGLPNLEEIVFSGDNLVISGAQFFDLPKLKKVVFNGNSFLMNGSVMVGRSPNFESFEINGLVTLSEIVDPVDCPLFKDYSGDFVMLYNGNSSLINQVSLSEVAENKKYVDDFNQQLKRLTEIYEDHENNLEISRNFMYFHPQIIRIANAMNVDTVAYVAAHAKAHNNPYFWTKLETLQHSPAYAPDSVDIDFTYQSASAACLVETREYFNLDSIAGNGDDISRITNLTYWIHDVVRHDGRSFNPGGPKSLKNLVDSCRQNDRGVNCRMMAIMLTEALLAEGIPARYLTCEPKDFDSDPDCHVICVAWSDSLNKWVWADPTFAAFVTDENGLMLHPGEVRERLINDKPLFINEDANWNHQSIQTKENYLDYYMAKNLYYITAITANRQAPENDTICSTYVTLSPVDSNFTNSQIVTTDYDTFWQAPK